MDLNLTEEHKLIQKRVKEFACNELEPIASKLDELGKPPLEQFRKLGELGFLGLMVPPEYGGTKADTVSYVLVVEELSRVCASTGIMVAIQNSLVCQPIALFGTEDQKKRYLPDLASGRAIGAFALTEPEAGSDAASIRTRAVKDGDYYVISGLKHFITNGTIADVVIVFATIDPALRHKGITAFIVEKGTPGFKVGREDDKMGIRGTNTSELIFEDCRIPVSNRLGQEGEGFKIALMMLDSGRIGVAAQAVGIARRAYEEALKYAKTRQQFGQPIAQFQAIQWMLVDMATRIEAARLLTLKAALKKDAGERYTKEAAMAKLFASETAVWVTNKAVQIHGGYGYMKEYVVERLYRDAKITEIYEGTNEIQRLVIANQLLQESLP
ncbi:MAG: acyl-CoA dehydrogenase [Anaerolineae bacterium]|nr:acyl-CoA dehydrogenase [Anaerolineae bacterium]MDW8103076.1 acyl-CoA dehydrogenase [Anaerolineae bacterium]